MEAQQVAYHRAHRDELVQKQHEYYVAHKEERMIYSHNYHLANYSVILVNHQLWYKKNKEVDDKRHLQYQHAHPEIAQVGHQLYRARLASAKGSFTVEEFRQKCEEYDYKCAYCGVEGIGLTIDHVVPLSKGGTCYIDNIVPACLSCNSKKRDKDLAEFLEEIC